MTLNAMIVNGGGALGVAGTVASLAVATPGIVAAAHVGMLGAGSLFYRERLPSDAPAVRLLIVVPAHNEELVLADTLAAIRSSMRARDTLLVVDDRSTDRTGEIARSAGAMVLRRVPARRRAGRRRGRRRSSVPDRSNGMPSS